MPGKKRARAGGDDAKAAISAAEAVTAERRGAGGRREYEVRGGDGGKGAAAGGGRWVAEDALLRDDVGARAIDAFYKGRLVAEGGGVTELTTESLTCALRRKLCIGDTSPLIVTDDGDDGEEVSTQRALVLLHPYDLRDALRLADPDGDALSAILATVAPPKPAAKRRKKDEKPKAKGKYKKGAAAAAEADDDTPPAARLLAALCDIPTGEEESAAHTAKGPRKTAAAQRAAARGVAWKSQKAWAQGTGFGGTSGYTYGRDGDPAAKARAEKRERGCDQKTAAALSKVVAVLRDRRRDGQPLLPLWPCYCAVLCSELPAAVSRLLRNDSLLDIAERAEVYHHLMALLSVLSGDAALSELLISPDRPGTKPPAELLRSLAGQAGIFLKQAKAQQEEEDFAGMSAAMSIRDAADEVHSRLATVQKGRKVAMRSTDAKEAEEAKKPGDDLSDKKVAELRKEAERIGVAKAKMARTKVALAKQIEQKQTEDDEMQKRYMRHMEPLKFDLVDLKGSAARYPHHYADRILSNPLGHSGQSRRMKEIAGFSNGLPIHWSSSIFVRADQQRTDVFKVLIIGPEGTPYANGCFTFDMWLGPTYPAEPPRVWLMTTLGNKIRFNPNLYACGQVCLSLLGTWSGPGWEPKQSTLLQVLLSIQSMILVNNPFYNEPGWEAMAASKHGQKTCELYNRYIQLFTARAAVLDQLRNPAPCFKEIIQKHFAIKRDRIKEQLKGWLEDSATPSQCPHNLGLAGGHYGMECSTVADGKPSKVLRECCEALDKLKLPKEPKDGEGEC